MARPICVHCGAAYGQRSTSTVTLQWADGEEKPAYRGNGKVVKERYHGVSLSPEAYRRLRPTFGRESVRREVDAEAARLPEKPTHTAYLEVWDGESWFGGCKPFCTNRCAISYARKAYAAHQQNVEDD